MPPVRTARQRAATNENDENAAPARLTRAKAATTGGNDEVSEGMVKKALANKKPTALGGNARTKRALGDATNVMKVDGAKDKKSATRAALGAKSTNGITKPAATGKNVIKKAGELKRTASSTNPETRPTKKRAAVDPLREESENEEVKPATKTKEEPKAAEPIIEAYEAAEVPDLDQEDLEDPLMVAEYAVEIFEYLRELEESTMPNEDYMNYQDHVDWSDRDILNDWLVQVHQRFSLLPETFYLAINIIDRFLSTKIVQLDKLQLVGITALFIASKYEEVISPHITNFSYMAKDYPDTEILSAERFILQALNYNLSYPNPLNFLRRISKADNYDVQTRTIGKYLLEISMMDHRFLNFPPSQCAAAAMYMSRMILNRGEWDATLAHYSGYTEAELLPVFELLLDYCSGDIRHEAFDNKYASKRYLKASLILRQWSERYLLKLQKMQDAADRKST